MFGCRRRFGGGRCFFGRQFAFGHAGRLGVPEALLVLRPLVEEE
jgi:hypothetical protein